MEASNKKELIIRNNFKIDSKEKYLWKIGKPTNHNYTKEIVRNIPPVLIAVFVPFALLILIAWISPLVATLISGIFVVVAIYIKVADYTDNKKINYYENLSPEVRESRIVADSLKGEFKKMFSAIFFLVLASCLVYIASSSYLKINSLFEGQISSNIEWLYFYIDNILKVLLFDIAEIFGLQFSSIQSNSQGSKLMTLFINLSITAGLLEVILMIYKTETKEFEIVGTMAEAYGIMVLNTGNRTVDVYKISGEKNIGEYTTADFSNAFKV